MDHDQRFKVLVEEFFPELMDLFWPEWGAKFDFNSVTWLKEELFKDPPKGERLRVDMVAQLKLLEPANKKQKAKKDWLALVHVEIESRESVEQLRERMHDYYQELRKKHRLPVLPLAILLNVGLNGLGVDEYKEFFGGFCLLHFRFLYAGFPGLDGAKYICRGTTCWE